MTVAADSKSFAVVHICVNGCVQGAGVRPTIARLATSLDLAGAVRNTMFGLEIEVEGTAARIAMFQQRLPASLPADSVVNQIDVVAMTPSQRSEFVIERDDAAGSLTTQVPRDLVMCEDCFAEIDDQDNRRHRYPLTTCATCGPRFSLIQSMPFDRVRTTLDSFTLCDDCRAEYKSPKDRRYHAQTIGCAKCGPHVWLANARGQRMEIGPAAVSTAARLLRDGKIVAMRGVGGYQLLCDATNPIAVRRLRRRKARPAKPFAVLVASPDEAGRHANICENERAALTNRSNPIVLLQAKLSGIVHSVHPGLNKRGVMLPSTPLHAMLCREVGTPLVCTSANREGEPLEHDVQAAESNLSGIADVWLHHNRPISRPIDDSVVQMIGGRRVTLRLGRGFAPLPLTLPVARPQLAVGGHMKSTIAWHNGSQAVLGPHIGDLDTVTTRERFQQHVADMESLYRFESESVVHDLHPDYFTTRFSTGRAGKPAGVQHHFAHVAAGMLEHALLDDKVLGVSWDGTGYGADGTIWGGEFLVVDGATSYTRVAHLRPFPWFGSEIAIHQPWRIAVALLSEAFTDEEWSEQADSIWNDRPVAALRQMHRQRTCPTVSTSAGRLFDAVAAIILGIDVIQYEGQAAMMLESAASLEADGSYVLLLESGELDWREMLRAIWKERLAGIPREVISARFHRALASGIVAVADAFPKLPVVLTGGVFQNKLLTELVVEMLDDHDRIKLPGMIPPNDGGLAAGQLAIAVMRERARGGECQ